MKNILITGVSSGIGNTLSKLLIRENYSVWGIARRKNLLLQLEKEMGSKNYFYTIGDVTDNSFWKNLVKKFKLKKFIPDVVVFNAAINNNDLINEIDLNMLRRIMEVNFFSVLKGIKILSGYNKKAHFICISSTSAFKGYHKEGIGYAVSKSAISIAFESLFQKYQDSKVKFTTIFFGPVKTGMVRFTKVPPFTLTAEKAARCILLAIQEKKSFYYYPKPVFIFLRLMRLIPNELFFSLWTRMQKKYAN